MPADVLAKMTQENKDELIFGGEDISISEENRLVSMRHRRSYIILPDRLRDEVA